MSETAEREKELALLKLLGQVWNDPKIGEQVRRRSKELNPQIEIMDDNGVVVAVRNEIGETKQELSALRKLFDENQAKVAQREQESELRERLARAQSRFKLTDEGMSGTIELMQKRQISDPEAAAALYVDSLPKTQPSAHTASYLGSKFDPARALIGGTDPAVLLEKAFTDENAFFNDIVNDVFREMPVQAA